MVRLIHLIAAGAFLVSASAVFGQATGQSVRQNRNQQSASLAAGTALNAELSRPLDSKKAKPGDVVAAQTTEAVKVDGKVVIPSNTKLVGHVTRASARAKGDADSVLAMQFDRAVLKDGREMPLQVTLQAMAADQGAPAVSGDDLRDLLRQIANWAHRGQVRPENADAWLSMIKLRAKEAVSAWDAAATTANEVGEQDGGEPAAS